MFILLGISNHSFRRHAYTEHLTTYEKGSDVRISLPVCLSFFCYVMRGTK
nr:MAG TPA: hypothetical protein [Caudoviricetes sp.]DAP99623.1 MAG TPA: hypothetical protein [Caudoviricetes sp.]DAS07915.1 MAG TPA: hypothetical protein [Caudoviricetes sp.]DAW79827.1 MAG TPA: hypothetical protein [Caudoviricetes sp.]